MHGEPERVAKGALERPRVRVDLPDELMQIQRVSVPALEDVGQLEYGRQLVLVSKAATYRAAQSPNDAFDDRSSCLTSVSRSAD